MSTHAYVGLENPDGSVEFVYCHFDGHPDRMAPRLTQNYSDPSLVRRLVRLGPYRSIGATLETCSSWSALTLEETLHKVGNADVMAEHVRWLGGTWGYLFRSDGWKLYDPESRSWQTIP